MITIQSQSRRGVIAFDNYRPNQTGFEQLPVVTDSYVCFCITLILRFSSVSDQTVAPRINHSNLQAVLVGLQGTSNLYPKRLCPHHTHIMAVQRYGSDANVFDLV